MRTYKIEMEKATKMKEFFYIGLAHAEDGHRIVKFGTSNDLKRRKGEHRRHKYSPAEFSLKDFEYVSFIPLSHANTIRLENSFRKQFCLMAQADEVYLKNDRFVINHNEEIVFEISVTNKKTYTFIIPAE